MGYKLNQLKVSRDSGDIALTYNSKIFMRDIFLEATTYFVEFLPYSLAKPYIHTEITEEQWNQEYHTDLDNKLCQYTKFFIDLWHKAIMNRQASTVLNCIVAISMLMMIAGLKEWEEILNTDLHDYGIDAYNRLWSLFDEVARINNIP